jgi:hypothetical protein
MSQIPEKSDLGDVQRAESANGQWGLKASNVDFERGELLANLPDPDFGKSEEEKRAIDRKLMWKVDLWLVPWLSVLFVTSV